ncbi:MAG: ArsJ-associated glyceraldehyde-3-phosphate dehydrogenase [SAR324 cluster bacterium]|nr:ArsJ-associated glyceraldehyde-3-phosphate dehydrogenase [SAR324 cluster bacterium]
MKVNVGINGFGRMGKLALRAAWGRPDIEIVHINEIAADAKTSAHLLEFDSVHGKWDKDITANGDHIMIDGKRVGYSSESTIETAAWNTRQVDMVLECSGKFKTPEALEPYFQQGVQKILVSAPVKEDTLNIVMGINDHLYDPEKHHRVTAASCTTNCLAPVVKVIHEKLGIRHGVITTIHDITNTQTIVDIGHQDLRRARACGMSLIPTTTGSATAITQIFPELTGKLNGVAVRVPLLNASLTDCVFEVNRETTVEEVNHLFKEAAEGALKGILGYEERPLVSIDYKDDIRSSIIDAPSTMVVDKTQVKLLAWYDNEIGYVYRMVEFAQKIAKSM